MKRCFRTFGKILLWTLLLVFCVTAAAGTVCAVQGHRMYREAKEETPLKEKAAEIQEDERYTPYQELPQFYIDAVICVEDKRFESHPGVDILAIERALWEDIRSMSLEQGGSTITQQLAKNMYFTQEKKLKRKFAEVFAAFEIEREYDKKEIFAMYVNSIYFGSGYYGITEAAQGYYGKTPAELTKEECAMLAGLPNAPSAYSPDASPALARQRLRQVLNRMVACGKLSEEEALQIAP